MKLNTHLVKKGFTLIELLVVIAIIAILAAILFPVFGRARENARRSSCQSNLKQVGLGILQYTQDYDERFVPGAFWNTSVTPNDEAPFQVLVQPYMKSRQVFSCPSNQSTTWLRGTPADNKILTTIRPTAAILGHRPLPIGAVGVP